MKTKTTFKLLSIATLVVCSVLSCSKDDDHQVFSETPTERISNQQSELSTLLTNEPQGYKATYFSKKDEYGGVTFYFKFNADGTVKSTSDFDNNTAIETTSYRVSTGTSAAELVFEDRGHIQKMSNPSLEGLVGKGFKGTSVFQYFGNENGTLTFRDTRNADTGFLTLTPSGFSNFETESIASVQKSLAQRRDFLEFTLPHPFLILSVKTQQTEKKYDFNYDPLRYFAKLRTKSDDGGDIKEEKVGLLFTEDGVLISPALEIDGISFGEFTEDNSGDEPKYISTVGNNTAILGYGQAPITPLDAYRFGERRDAARYNNLEPNKSSLKFNDFYSDFNTNLSNTYGITLDRFYFFRLKQEGGAWPYIIFWFKYGPIELNIWYRIDFEVENGIVKFSLPGQSNSSPAWDAVLQPLLDVLLLAPEGYYLKKTGGLMNYSNRTYSMINGADPTMWVNYYDFLL